MQEQVTINQHYVPRFYMNPFSTIINEGTRKEKALISFYQFKNMICRDNVPTKSICSEDYFYDKDGHVENKLAEKETLWNKAITKVNNDETLSELEINTIREFVVFQIIRTKAMTEHFQEVATTIMTDSVSNGHCELDKNIIRENVKKKVEKDITPEFGLDLAKDTIHVISDLDIAIINNKTEIPFITSDVPIIVINPLGISRAGFNTIGEAIFFPVSEFKLVMFYDNRLYVKIQEEIHEEDIIHTVNKYQYISADERILSSESNIFATYIENEELNEKRKEFNLTPKTNTTFDGFGTFIATKSRSIKYYYDISILKLPKQLRKIPTEFRETFPREYSYETRIALLCRIYRQPDFLHNAEEVHYWKQSQKYSKMLLDYLDYYWKTPKADRTISGKDMYMLKTVPVTKFKL